MLTRPTRTALWLTLLTLIIGLGAGLRLWAIDHWPPLALHPDEAQYGLNALQVLQQGQWQVFAPENGGREALFMLLAAGAFQLFGVSVLTFRVFTAGLGILTLPAFFWLGWEAAPRRAAAPWVGLLAAACLATLFLHVVITRNALRVNLLPLVTALAGAALLRAFRGRQMRWFIVAGALWGLSLYTYTAARILPALIPIAFGLWAWHTRPPGRTLAGWLAGAAGAGVLVALPLGLYFLQHPELFWYRASDLFDRQALGRSVVNALLIFHFQGEPILNFNLPGRPVFDAVQAVVFGVGVLVALLGRAQPTGRWLLVWFGLALLPATLTEHGSVYSHAYGMLPPLVVLMSYGYEAAATWLGAQMRRWPGARALARPLSLGLVLLGLSYSAWRTGEDYFVHWARRTDLSLAYRTDLMRIDLYAQSLPPTTEFFFSPYAEIEAPLQFTRQRATARFHPYDGHACVPVGDAAHHPLTYFVGDPNSLAVLHQYYPTGETTAAPEFPIFQVAAGTPRQPAPTGTGQAIWAAALTLPSATVQVLDAQTVQVNLVWQTQAPRTAAAYHRFIHLLTDDPTQPNGVQLWAQSDDALCHGTYPAAQWQLGEYLVDTVTLTAATPLPAGDYRVAVGLYEPGAPIRLAVAETNWPLKDDTVTFATFTIK